MSEWRALLATVRREPRRALAAALARLKGRLYLAWYRLRGIRVRAGPGLRVFGRLRVRGPGEVILGRDVALYGTVTPFTHAPEARITIGDHTMMDGVRLGCAQEIAIGRHCIIAEARILDTDFHSARVDRRFNAAAPVRVAPVTIGDNVWVGLEAGILPGVVIGRNSVVAYGAVCVREYPPDSVIMGNPARVVSPIPPGGEYALPPVPEREPEAPVLWLVGGMRDWMSRLPGGGGRLVRPASQGGVPDGSNGAPEGGPPGG
jgi:acetyltransferase-like isoleucine patch superfamily enzyme